MGFLHQFTVSVLLIAFLSCFCDNLVCEGPLKKYTALVTGLVVSLCIVNSILQIRDFRLEEVHFEQSAYEMQDASVQDTAVETQFRSDLEGAIETSVFDKFKCQVKAYADVRILEGKVYIESVEIDNTAIKSEALSDFIETQFGIVPEIR